MHKFSEIVRNFCLLKTTQLWTELTHYGFEIVKADNGQTYAFRKGKHTSSPMIVCHADTVRNGGNGQHQWAYSKGTATSIALDDRLGIACMVWSIQNESPLAQCAMLVCDEEETGNSSASTFDQPVQPNWMVELDRRGLDVVCYEYHTEMFASILESSGFEVGHGSFSDICYLTHLGVVGFNCGVGYHNEHSDKCHAKLSETLSQLEKLERFFVRFGDIRLAHATQSDWKSERDSFDWDYAGRTYSLTEEVYDALDTIEAAMANNQQPGGYSDEVKTIFNTFGFDPLTNTLDEVHDDLEAYLS